MGTIVEIAISAKPGAPLGSRERAFILIGEAFQEIARLEKVFSRFDPESELSRLNGREAGTWIPGSDELNRILALGETIERCSHGSFRLMPECPHGPGQCYELKDQAIKKLSTCAFDLGGIAKGYIVDQVFERLRNSAPDAKILINAGGDLRCSHEERIELRVPGEDGDGRYSLTIQNAALATSSLQGSLCSVGTASARYPQNTRTDAPALSASVVAKSCGIADAIAKVALLGDATRAMASDLEVGMIYLFDRQGKALT
ncbi:MAG: FAD:protein FMN transferase [Oligoflexia bacterium]|nr:FAD:protein FMN transferase [Oligoflexia bacterium]